MRTEKLNYGTANPFLLTNNAVHSMLAKHSNKQIAIDRLILCVSSSLRFCCLFYYTNLVSISAPSLFYLFFLGGGGAYFMALKTRTSFSMFTREKS